jgi:ubiquinone/menaquinone biosynthesis C-methylase UbiE
MMMNSSSAVTTRSFNLSGMSRRRQHFYDRLASVYPISSYLFHAEAHRVALEQASVRDGMNILEVATGSGELFRRLVQKNPTGKTVGLDLSQAMAARTQRIAQRKNPGSKCFCHSASACKLPLADRSFDRVFSCLMMELLDRDKQLTALMEFRRVLRPGGRLTLVLIGEDSPAFNWIFRRCVRVVPAFWGIQIEKEIHEGLQQAGFRIVSSGRVRQNGYPTLILTLE